MHILPLQGKTRDIPEKSAGWWIESQFQAGHWLIHSPDIIIRAQRAVINAEISAVFQSAGRKAWQQRYRCPTYGITALFSDFAYPEVLGYGFAITPFFDFSLVQRKHYRFLLRLGAGPGWVSNYYNNIDNPNHNIIGSAFNLNGHVKLLHQINLHPRWRLLLSGSFVHYSNSSIRKPNLGINMATLSAGIQYQMRAKPTQETAVPDTLPLPFKSRWVPYFRTGFAYSENTRPDGPPNRLWITTAGLGFHTGKYHRLLFAYVHELRTDHHFKVRLRNEIPLHLRGGLHWHALQLGSEIRIGNASIVVQTGYYLNELILYQSKWLYTKIGAQYYFPPMGRQHRLLMGLFMKSHFATADYMELSFGYSF